MSLGITSQHRISHLDVEYIDLHDHYFLNVRAHLTGQKGLNTLSRKTPRKYWRLVRVTDMYVCTYLLRSCSWNTRIVGSRYPWEIKWGRRRDGRGRGVGREWGTLIHVRFRTERMLCWIYSEVDSSWYKGKTPLHGCSKCMRSRAVEDMKNIWGKLVIFHTAIHYTTI